MLTYTSSSNAYLDARRIDVAVAVRKLGVSVIDPTNWFCTANECPAVVANTIVYRDDSHMTQHYSRALEPVLARSLTSELAAAGR